MTMSSTLNSSSAFIVGGVGVGVSDHARAEQPGLLKPVEHLRQTRAGLARSRAAAVLLGHDAR